MRAGDEDEVETAAQVVGLQASADGCGKLEGRLSESDAGEGNGSGRDETDSLQNRVSMAGIEDDGTKDLPCTAQKVAKSQPVSGS